jgi:dCTP deaminase
LRPDRGAAAVNSPAHTRFVVLSDRDILSHIDAGRIGVDPFDPRCVQPASVDIRLDHRFRVFRSSRHAFIDLAAPLDDVTELVDVEPKTRFILHPGEFVLGSTRERIRLPDDIVSRVEGKSSLGRLGLLIHSTAGFIDPGWDGHITLELSNVNTIPITLYPGMRIGQLSFFALSSPAEHPYGSPEAGSSYQGQSGPTPSRYRLDV